MSGLADRLEEAAASLARPAGSVPPVAGIVAGGGFEEWFTIIAAEGVHPWTEIPHAPPARPGSGLAFGTIAGRPVATAGAIPAGGEGRTAAAAAFPVRLLHLIGIPVVIICDRAIGLDERLTAGEVMLVTDHINLTGDNPLIGPNDERLGPRFPDMSAAYSADLIALARSSAIAERIPLSEGVLAAVNDPDALLEEEGGRLRELGADAVGAGVVHEVTAAVHLGMATVALTAITRTDPGLEPGTEQIMRSLVERLTGEF